MENVNEFVEEVAELKKRIELNIGDIKAKFEQKKAEEARKAHAERLAFEDKINNLNALYDLLSILDFDKMPIRHFSTKALTYPKVERHNFSGHPRLRIVYGGYELWVWYISPFSEDKSYDVGFLVCSGGSLSLTEAAEKIFEYAARSLYIEEV